MSRDIRDRVAAEFTRQTAQHQLTILHDDGLYRHLRLARPNTGIESFHIVTWPGYLAYAGDMGDFTFARVPDMFTFFRGHFRPDLGYWAEKVQAADKCEGIREYSEEIARAWVKEQLDNYEASDEVRAEAENIDYDNGEVRLYDSVGAIDFQGFADHWEANLKEYTFRFVWCCLALPWAIDLYDQQKGTR